MDKVLTQDGFQRVLSRVVTNSAEAEERKDRLTELVQCRRISTTSKLRSEDPVVHRDTTDNNAGTPFEFTQANLTRISAFVGSYPEGAQRSVLGAALDIVQRQIGWIPISAMHKIAEILSIPRMRVYEFATFYTMYNKRYKGKYHVKVCVTTPCMIMGSDLILQAVEQECCCTAGHVSSDGMFGVEEVQCQGACVNAPVVAVNDDYYEDVTICDIQNIIQTLRCGGIPRFGPQSGRFASEPKDGLTSLCGPPPPPGFGVQPALFKPK